MLIIKKGAYKILLRTLSNNLHKSSEYGSPPIFYWYRNMIEETRKIESCRYIRCGEFQYRLGYNLGVAHVTCQYVGRKRFLIVTNYDINNSVLFSWKGQSNSSGIISKVKNSKPKKQYRRLTRKPLFGYSFVMNDRKEYNLIDSNENLLTQWFRDIRPINKPQPYGKYQIIAYINVGGFFCALGYDGQVYNLNKTWKEMCSENRDILNTALFMNIITENIDNTMKNKKVIRLTESDLHRIVKESVKDVLIAEGFFNDTKIGRGIRNGAIGLGLAAGSASCSNNRYDIGYIGKGVTPSVEYRQSPNNNKCSNDSTDVMCGCYADDWSDEEFAQNRDYRLDNKVLQRRAAKIMKDENVDRQTAIEIAIHQLIDREDAKKNRQNNINKNALNKYGVR